MENPNPSVPESVPPPVPAIRLATAGEALIDCVSMPDGHLLPVPGGAVFNLTRGLARMGVPVAYLNPLSSDRMGRWLARTLALDGVRLAVPEPVMQPTSLALVHPGEGGQPDYAFYRDGVADRAVTAASLSLHCAKYPRLQVVAAGALALDPRDADIYPPWLAGQRAAGRQVVIDANLRPQVMPDVTAYRRHVLDVLQLADLVKVSDEDLCHLGCRGDTPLEQALALLAGLRAEWMALTLGPHGALLIHRDAGVVSQAVDAQPVPVADTVGAGDSFLAALLAAWMEPHFDPVSGLAQAVAAASLCVMQAGCQPASRDAVMARARGVSSQAAVLAI